MDLNLDSFIFHDKENNSFNTKFEHSYDIATLYSSKIKKYLNIETQNIIQNFQLTCGVFKNNTLYFGDNGGFIMKVNEDRIFEIIYQHDRKVNQIIERPFTDQFFSCSDDDQIFIYDTTLQSDIIIVKSTEGTNCMALNEGAKILYSAGNSGNIQCWNMIAWNKLKTLETSSIPITTMQFNDKENILLIGNELGEIYFYNSFDNRMENLKVSDQKITAMIISPNKQIFYFGTEKGIIEGWLMKQKKNKVTLNSQGKFKICNLIFANYNTELFALTEKGAVFRYLVFENNFEEWRKYQKLGNYFGIFHPQENALYVGGYQNYVEKFCKIQTHIIEEFERQEIASLEKFEFFQFIPYKDEFKIVSRQGNLINFQITDDIKKNQVLERVFLQTQTRIISLFFIKNYIYFCDEDNILNIFDLETCKIIQNIKLPFGDLTDIFYFEDQNVSYIFNRDGNLLTIDMQQFRITRNEPFEFTSSNILSTKFSKSQKFVYILKEQGNIIIKNFQSKEKVYNMILNDDNISCFYYCEKNNMLYTADVCGTIVETQFIEEDKCNSNLLIDRNILIEQITVNDSNNILAFSTSKNKIYLFDLKNKFFFDKIGRTYYKIEYLFFSLNSNGLISIGDQGIIQYWELIHNNELQSMNFITNTVDVKCMDLNDEFIFTLTYDSLFVWSIQDLTVYKILTQDYENVNKIQILPNGEQLILLKNNNTIEQLDVNSFDFPIQIINLEDEKIISFYISDDCNNLIISTNLKKLIFYDLENKNIKNDFYSFWELKDIKLVNQQFIIGEISAGQYCIHSLEGEILSLIGKPSNMIKGYTIGPNFQNAFLVHKDGSIQAWDIFNGEIIYQFENNEIPISEVISSEDNTQIYVLGTSGQITIYETKTGQIVKTIQLGLLGKINLLRRFGQKLAFVSNNNPQLITSYSHLNFYEKQYIRKTFLEYGKAGSEKNFLTFFQNIIPYYLQSKFLQDYFNPYFACSLFNYQRGMQYLLEQKDIKYPMLNDHKQVSPLVLGLKLDHLNLAELILSTLIKNYQNYYFSNREMKELLDSKYNFTHKYLSYFMVQIKQFTGTELNVPILSKLIENFKLSIQPSYHYTPKKYQMLTQPYADYQNDQRRQSQIQIQSQMNTANMNQEDQTHLISQIKGKIMGNIKSFNVSQQSTEYSVVDNQQENNQVKENQKLAIQWIPTKFYRINGLYQFEIGSSESLYFLENYSESETPEFVLSNWRYIIDYKWKQIFKRLIIPTLLNWVHGIFFNLAMLYPQLFYFYVFDFIAIIIIFFYEFISMLSSGFKKYFSSFNNIFDILIIFLCIAVNILTYIKEGLNQELNVIWLEILQIICLFIIYYRCITFLRVFKTFRNVIDMLLSVTFSILSLLVISALFIFATSIMNYKAYSSNDRNFIIFVQENFFLMQGAIISKPDPDDNVRLDFNSLEWILFVLNCLLIPIILVNFLIAKMSNTYVYLEQIEEVTSYKEKAALIAEIEYFYILRNKKKQNQKKDQFSKGFTFIARNTSKDKELFADEKQGGEETITMDLFQQQIEQLNKDFKKQLEKRQNNFEEQIDNFKLIKQGVNYMKTDLKILQEEEKNDK